MAGFWLYFEVRAIWFMDGLKVRVERKGSVKVRFQMSSFLVQV